MALPSLGADTISELLERFERSGGDLDRLVVVGGSAGFHWYLAIAEQQGAENADFLDEMPLQTSDLDLQVDTNDDPFKLIDEFAAAVGGRVVRPDAEDNTPELAVVIIDGFLEGGHPLKIDFLPQIHGIGAQDTLSHAQPLATDEAREVLFIHPVHLLLGTVANYLDLPSRRQPETLRRIDQLIALVRRYTIARAQSQSAEGEADARWTMQTILRAADAPRLARFVLDTERDIVNALPDSSDAPVNENFWRSEYPRKLAKARDRLNRAKRRRANTGHTPRGRPS